MTITEHFSRKEMTCTNTGFSNEPNPKEFANLYDLCSNVLEPVRKLLSEYAKKVVRIKTTSGFRSEEVNETVNGAKDSQHCKGQACDFIPLGLLLTVVYELIRKSDIPFDQMILENGWIHISYSENPRRQAWIK